MRGSKELVPGSFATFADRVRVVLALDGITQTELAKRIGSTQATVAQTLYRVKDPRMDTLVRYANALNVTVGYLAGMEDE